MKKNTGNYFYDLSLDKLTPFDYNVYILYEMKSTGGLINKRGLNLLSNINYGSLGEYKKVVLNDDEILDQIISAKKFVLDNFYQGENLFFLPLIDSKYDNSIILSSRKELSSEKMQFYSDNYSEALKKLRMVSADKIPFFVVNDLGVFNALYTTKFYYDVTKTGEVRQSFDATYGIFIRKNTLVGSEYVHEIVHGLMNSVPGSYELINKETMSYFLQLVASYYLDTSLYSLKMTIDTFMSTLKEFNRIKKFNPNKLNKTSLTEEEKNVLHSYQIMCNTAVGMMGALCLFEKFYTKDEHGRGEMFEGANAVFEGKMTFEDFLAKNDEDKNSVIENAPNIIAKARKLL